MKNLSIEKSISDKEEIESVIETVVTLEDTEMQNINSMPYVKPKDEILHERVTLH